MTLKTNRKDLDKTLKDDGQHCDYLILSDEERAKGFVRPVRVSYLHIGTAGPMYPLEDLMPEAKYRYEKFGYIKYEKYIKKLSGAGGALGRFWTQEALDLVGKGCGSKTTMPQAIAETYARDPGFYSSTFCVTCGCHFPVGADGEFIWEDGSRVGT